jgi:ATP-binding cassette subfamily F protein 3
MVEKLKAQQREYESQMEYRKHVQEFIDKFRYVYFFPEAVKRGYRGRHCMKIMRKLCLNCKMEERNDV